MCVFYGSFWAAFAVASLCAAHIELCRSVCVSVCLCARAGLWFCAHMMRSAICGPSVLRLEVAACSLPVAVAGHCPAAGATPESVGAGIDRVRDLHNKLPPSRWLTARTTSEAGHISRPARNRREFGGRPARGETTHSERRAAHKTTVQTGQRGDGSGGRRTTTTTRRTHRAGKNRARLLAPPLPRPRPTPPFWANGRAKSGEQK